MATETRQPTCEERIADRAERRLSEIRDFLFNYRHDTEEGDYRHAEDLLQGQQESILSVDKSTVYKVELSTGGPGDWFEIHVSDDDQITHIEYHFNDWFDHAERNLTGADFDAVDEWLNYVVYIEGVTG